MKKILFRLSCVILILIFVFGTIPTVSAATTEKQAAHNAYYDYLRSEIIGIGGAIRDEAYYEMFTDLIKRPAITERLLAVYLVDVTNDGIEELIIKRGVKHNSSALLDLNSAEWICIYSYVNGKIERIGQNRSWIRAVGNGSWTYYEPTGYIGEILSAWDYPNISDDCITLCWTEDGKTYLCDEEIHTGVEDSFSFYGYNGTHMEKEAHFRIQFVPDWTVGSIHSQYGRHVYTINNDEVTATEFNDRVDYYTSRGTYELRNNDYHEVMNLLSDLIQGIDVPYGDANPHCHIPSADWIAENGEHYHSCQSGCDVKLDLASCTGGKSTCIQKAICTVCQQEYGDFAKHSMSPQYSFADGQHFFKCKTAECTYISNVSNCSDSEKNHKCDTCQSYLGTHEAQDGTHICQYCNQVATACEDESKDHKCDICDAYVGAHEAAQGTHICRYCDLPVSTCIDSNTDHECDICAAYINIHEAAEGTHICAYCQEAISDCVDADSNSVCDICEKEYSTLPPSSTDETPTTNTDEAPTTNTDEAPTTSLEIIPLGCFSTITRFSLFEIISFALVAVVVIKKRKTT